MSRKRREFISQAQERYGVSAEVAQEAEGLLWKACHTKGDEHARMVLFDQAVRILHGAAVETAQVAS